MTRFLTTFRQTDAGDITVNWLVLTATLVLLGSAVMAQIG